MITVHSTFSEIFGLEEFKPFSQFLLGHCFIPDLGMSLREMNRKFFDWVDESIAHGLNRVLQLRQAGEQVGYPLYSEDEIAASPDKEDTILFFMRGEPGKPFVVICPGGGYGAVCTLKEGFTVGARLNELGYNAFVVSYRVRPRGEDQALPHMPKPIDDLARAIEIIRDRQDEFGVDINHYAVAGFSSGAHLAGEWGTENVGARAYGLPAPEAVFLGYSASDPTVYPVFRGKNFLLENMLGEKYEDAEVEKYNVNANIDEAYPVTYLWHCQDDNIIPVRTSEIMEEKMKEAGRPCIFRRVLHGGHGFGLGEYSEARGWLEEALEFWSKFTTNN